MMSWKCLGLLWRTIQWTRIRPIVICLTKKTLKRNSGGWPSIPKQGGKERKLYWTRIGSCNEVRAITGLYICLKSPNRIAPVNIFIFPGYSTYTTLSTVLTSTQPFIINNNQEFRIDQSDLFSWWLQLHPHQILTQILLSNDKTNPSHYLNHNMLSKHNPMLSIYEVPSLTQHWPSKTLSLLRYLLNPPGPTTHFQMLLIYCLGLIPTTNH